jgi:hypothetical protein
MRGEARRLPGEDPSRPLPSAPGLLPSSQPAGRRWKRVGSGAVSTAEGTAGELAGAKGVSTEQRSAAGTPFAAPPWRAGRLTHGGGGRRLAKGAGAGVDAVVASLGQGGGVEVGGLAAGWGSASGGGARGPRRRALRAVRGASCHGLRSGRAPRGVNLHEERRGRARQVSNRCLSCSPTVPSHALTLAPSRAPPAVRLPLRRRCPLSLPACPPAHLLELASVELQAIVDDCRHIVALTHCLGLLGTGQALRGEDRQPGRVERRTESRGHAQLGIPSQAYQSHKKSERVDA